MITKKFSKSSQKPLVSILIPTRDRADQLYSALISALNQTYTNLQIVVHDNSVNTDVKPYIKDLLKDTRVEYYKAKDDLSMTENWNTGFAFCTGEYFVRLDDDNVYKNNFIEESIKVIEDRNFDMMVYSCLYTDLNNSEYLLHEIDETIYQLSSKLYLYMEYNAFTDSNYVLYSKKLLETVLQDDFNLYHTNLPDRFLHYRIINLKNNLDILIGFSTIPMGVSRYDYRPRHKSTDSLKRINYKSVLDMDEIVQHKDCSDNFALHRALTIRYFFKRFDTNLEDFFENEVLSSKNYLMLSYLGQISQLKSNFSFKDHLYESKLFLVILIHMLLNPFAKYELKNNIQLLPRITVIFIYRNFKFIKNLILSRDREDDPVNLEFGDNVCSRVINNTYNFNNIKSHYNFYKELYSKFL